MFLLSALSLAGIPPLSGFVSKFALIEAGFADGARTPIVAVSLVVSLLTLFSMIRIWIGAFWSPPEERGASGSRPPVPRGGGPLAHGRAHRRRSSPAAWPSPSPPARSTPLSERTARDLLDRDSYIEKVLDR